MRVLHFACCLGLNEQPCAEVRCPRCCKGCAVSHTTVQEFGSSLPHKITLNSVKVLRGYCGLPCLQNVATLCVQFGRSSETQRKGLRCLKGDTAKLICVCLVATF